MTLTYSECGTLMSNARNRGAGKPLANHTRLFERGSGTYAVRLHSTDVVTINPDSTYVLNTGGWYTVTTKERINRYAPARVYSDRGIWCVHSATDPRTPARVTKCRTCKGTGVLTTAGYTERGAWDWTTGKYVTHDVPIVHPSTDHECWRCHGTRECDYGSKSNPVRFYDGMTVDSDGTCTDPDAKRLFDLTAEDERNARVLAAVRAYVNGLTDDEIARQWEYATTKGTAGDCWYCLMFEQAGMKSEDHLLSHIGLDPEAPDEIYYMASLTMNALKARGYRMPEVIFQIAASGGNHDGGNVRDSVSKYLRKRLITGRQVA